MDKNCCILVNSRFLYKSGIGLFNKSLIDILNNEGWIITIIANDKQSKVIEKLQNIEIDVSKIQIFGNENALPLKEHSEIYAFEEGIQYETVLNYRQPFLESCRSNIYDLILCNDVESLMSVYNLGMHKYIPVMYYTHCHSIIKYGENEDNSKFDVFSHQYIDVLSQFTKLPNIYIGTQSDLNKQLLGGGDNIIVLPIITDMYLHTPPSEKDLVKEGQEGILYIGRFEVRKNTDYLIAVLDKMKKAGTELPVVIITKTSNAIKFEKAFKKIGYNNYTIYSNVSEEEKVNIIKNCKLFFFPSQLEAYAIVIKETLPFIKSVVLSKFGWTKMWGDYVKSIQVESVVEDIIRFYNEPINAIEQLNLFLDLEKHDYECWLNFFKMIEGQLNSLTKKGRAGNLEANLTNEFVEIETYFKSLNKTAYYLSDYNTFYKKRDILDYKYEYPQKVFFQNKHNANRKLLIRSKE